MIEAHDAVIMTRFAADLEIDISIDSSFGLLCIYAAVQRSWSPCAFADSSIPMVPLVERIMNVARRQKPSIGQIPRYRRGGGCTVRSYAIADMTR